jgi:hypothetical protein
VLGGIERVNRKQKKNRQPKALKSQIKKGRLEAPGTKRGIAKGGRVGAVVWVRVVVT